MQTNLDFSKVHLLGENSLDIKHHFLLAMYSACFRSEAITKQNF